MNDLNMGHGAPRPPKKKFNKGPKKGKAPRQRTPKGVAMNGWLNFYKPVGMTSAQAVAMVKRYFNAQKVGHGGTLDPLAEGVLPLAFGRATKTMQFCLEADKAYEFVITFGSATTTDDAEGDVVKESDVRPTQADIEGVLGQFLGAIEQLPPLFSALKVNGKRAYDLARAGEEFELEKRPVTIKELALTEVAENADGTCTMAKFSTLVTKGTYVRSLARDIGEALGCFGHITELKRTKAGVFTLEGCVAEEALADLKIEGSEVPDLLPVGAVLADLPTYVASAGEQRLLMQGQSFARVHLEAGLRQVVDTRGAVLGVIEVDGDGNISVVRNFK